MSVHKISIVWDTKGILRYGGFLYVGIYCGFGIRGSDEHTGRL